MYLYFDKHGVLKEIINDDYIRLGNNNVNTIYAYFEEEPENITSVTGTIEYPDNLTTSNEYAFTTTVTQTIPYNKNAEYKYFKDFTDYKFYVLPLAYPDGANPPINLINQNGLYKVTIKAYTLNEVYAFGLVTFNVENSVVLEDNNVTQSQYEYLMQLVVNCVRKVVAGNIEGLPRVSKIDNNGNEIVLTQLNNVGLAGVKLRLKGSRLYFVRTLTNQQTHVETESEVAQITDLGYVTIKENGQVLFSIDDTGIYYRGTKVILSQEANSIITSMLQNNSVTYDKLSSTLQSLVNRFQTTSTKTIISPDGSPASDYAYEFTTTGFKITHTPSNKVVLNVTENGISTNALSINGNDIEDALIDINASISAFNSIIPDNTSSSNKLVNKAQADNDYAEKSLETNVSVIEGKIPSEASSSNKLADKNYVNDQINSVSAYYITKNALGEAFDTLTQLQNATNYYSGGVLRTPTRNDYAIVLSDSTHDNACTRYSYQGNQWEYQYTINETPMTQSQLDALNSGITSQKRVNYDGVYTNFNAIALDNSLTTGTLSETQKTKLTGALNIILRGDKRYYCIGLINGEYKFVCEITQDSLNQSKLKRDVITVNSSTGVWTYTADVEVAYLVDYDTLQSSYINTFYCDKNHNLTSDDISSLNDVTVVYYEDERYTFYKENPMTYINTSNRTANGKMVAKLISVVGNGYPFKYEVKIEQHTPFLKPPKSEELEAINEDLGTEYKSNEVYVVDEKYVKDHIIASFQFYHPRKSTNKSGSIKPKDFFGTRRVSVGKTKKIEFNINELDYTPEGTIEPIKVRYITISDVMGVFGQFSNYKCADDDFVSKEGDGLYKYFKTKGHMANNKNIWNKSKENEYVYSKKLTKREIQTLAHNPDYIETEKPFIVEAFGNSGVTGILDVIYSYWETAVSKTPLTTKFLTPSKLNKEEFYTETYPTIFNNIFIRDIQESQDIKKIPDILGLKGTRYIIQFNNLSNEEMSRLEANFTTRCDLGNFYIEVLAYIYGEKTTEDNVDYLTPTVELIPFKKLYK